MKIMTRRLFALFLVPALIISVAENSPAEPGKLWIEGSTESPGVQLNLPSFAPIIEKLGKAVVNISVEGKEGGSPSPRMDRFRGQRQDRGGENSQPPTPFDFFFQLPPEMQGKHPFQNAGSGFVIHPDGYLVTNNHVVENGTKIKVTFKDDKKEYNAKVIGRDKRTDLALLKVEANHPLESVVLGNSDSVRPGDWVIAIGNPFKLGHTATVGIVSAKSRKVLNSGYDDFIQTDASINPGNSGGPLFNAQGEVIGVNTAIFSPPQYGSAGFNIGIGFATPINLTKDIISQLYNGGKVTRGWLGVLIQKVDQDMADGLGLDSPAGALVADVMDGSPAKKAGFERGDVIVSYDGKKVEENDDLPLMVAQTAIGKEVKVEVFRKGKKQNIRVKVEELKDSGEESEGEPEGESRLGIAVQDITPEIARGLGLDSSTGVVITNVSPESEAERKGLRRGDVILEVNSQSVESSADFRKFTKDLPKNRPLVLLVNRNNQTIFFSLRLE